jgi:peptidoglycan/xylan/chitin deacetylase (PgdA/CDA1 family)
MKFLKEQIKNVLPDSVMTHKLHREAGNTILLTFDDGPDEKITPAVLRLLETYQARAVFFVVGRKVERSPHLLDLIGKKGHLIGNHSYRHPRGRLPGIRETGSYRRDVERCQQAIEKAGGRRPAIFRPPRGLTVASLLAARSLGLRTILYSAEGGEWGVRKSCGAQAIASGLLGELAPRDIVLLHDDNTKVPAVLEIILPAIQERNMDMARGVDYLTGKRGNDNAPPRG